MKILRYNQPGKWALLSVLMFHFCGLISTLVGADAGASAPGLLLFTTNGSGYPESVEFVSLSRKGSVLTDAVDAAGKHTEIPKGGILAVVGGPPARPDAKTPMIAAETLRQIEGLLAKYPRNRFPEVAQKLESLAVRWHTAETIAQSSKGTPVPSPMPSGPPKLTITTIDGQRYDDVVITRVDSESISFEHSAGLATVDLAKLPPDLQKRFNYDPQKAAAEKAAKQAAAEKTKAFAKGSPTSTPSKSNVPGMAGIAARATPAGSEISFPSKDQLIEFAKRWTEEAGNENAPPRIPVDSAKSEDLPDGSPGYFKTLDFINSRLRAPGKMGYSQKLQKMVLFVGGDRAYVFDPSIVSSDVKYGTEVERFSNQTLYYISVSARNRKRDIDAIGPTREMKTSGFTLYFGDSVETEKMAKAFSHLLSMLGAEADPF